MLLSYINNAFDSLYEISQVSSLNLKQECLIKNKDNIVFKSLLKLAYDPFQQFYIKKIPEFTTAEHHDTEVNYKNFLELLVKFSNRQLTGNAAIDALKEFLSGCNSKEVCWYTRVIQKDLKIGLADKGINKAFPKLIPTYEVMLADKINSEDLNLDTAKALKTLPSRFVCQYKIDGYRLNIHRPDKDTVIIRTRNGKFVSGYKSLEQSALELPVGYVYDGEVVSPKLHDYLTSIANGENTEMNRDMFGEVMSHAFSKEDNKEGIFNVFDVVKLDEWNHHESQTPYGVRLEQLDDFVGHLGLSNIVAVPCSKIYYKDNPDDLKEVVELFHKFVSIGWEGLMVKDYDAFYQWKRTKALLKMKMMDTLDLVVTDVYNGTGKYSGMLGGVTVDYKGNSLGVGSGFTDEDRKWFWENPNLIIGRTIEVSYQSVSHNKEGKESLSFPVFKGIRFDK